MTPKTVKESSNRRSAFILFDTIEDFIKAMTTQYIHVKGYICRLQVANKTKLSTLELSFIELGNRPNIAKASYILKTAQVKYLDFNISRYRKYLNKELTKIKKEIKIEIEIRLLDIGIIIMCFDIQLAAAIIKSTLSYTSRIKGT